MARPVTLAELYTRSARWRGAETLFADEHERFTGAQALGHTHRLARGISTVTSKGDVVAFLCRSSTRHAVAWFAAPLAGRVACSLHVRETPQRLGEVLAWLDAALLVHDTDLDGLAYEAVDASGRSCRRLSLGAGGSADLSFDEIPASDTPLDAPAPDDLAAIVLSSGSTGRPKGVMHTHRTLLEAAKGGQGPFGGLGPHDAVLLQMQPSFAAWAIIALPFVAAKGKVCFGGTFTPPSFLQTLERERITMAPLVPTMWRMIFAEDISRYDLSALKLVTISGEPPAPSDIAGLHASVCPHIASLYLSSEGFTGSAVYATTPDLLHRGKTAASGKPSVGVDVKIIQPAGGFDDVLPPGETGEIVISGPSLAIGYWKDPEESARRFQSGWWRSGDLGTLDADGDLWVVGRLDNIINTGGIKVSGEEVERAILDHPAVVQCAVVGVADPQFGQRVEAYVVCKGEAPALDAIQAFLRERGALASYKFPKVLHAVSELPTGPTGKLYRRGLRER